MRFGPIPVAEAEGAILAHSQTVNGRKLRKGARLAAGDVAALQAAGIAEVTVARLGAEDVDENTAAWRLASALAPLAEEAGLRVAEPFTGRVNLFATRAGVLTVDRLQVDSLNAVDPAITLATLPAYTRVAPGDMVATLKIIPYGVSDGAVMTAEDSLGGSLALVVNPPVLSHARLILTETPGFAPGLLAKGQAAVEARLSALGIPLSSVRVVPHQTGAVAAALAEGAAPLTLILGASATSDVMDVCPRALVEAGGAIDRFGMPVDPGNLLFLGDLGGAPVVGLPGCARSPALNGADWVLERLVCGVDISGRDIARMGVGGLLKEIPTRPQPRAYKLEAGQDPIVELILLAAGASRRMGGADKLLQPLDGETLLTRTTRAALSSVAARVHTVVPPDSPQRTAALEGLRCNIVVARDAAEGMSASLRAGLAAVSPRADAVVIALADMPDVGPAEIDRLIAAFDPENGAEICRAVSADGRPGHPVLFSRRFFENLAALRGDEGARTLMAAAGDFLRLVPTEADHALTDLDTPEAWTRYRAKATAGS